MAEVASLENPILNSPYEPPARHFVIGSTGPTGEVRDGRRPSESFIPVPVGRKGRAGQVSLAEQQGFDFDATGERREVNSLINDIRARVELWRARGYGGVTPISRKLLQHWADPHRDDRVLFCQREAAETAIYLAEVAGRRGEPDFRTRVDTENAVHNQDLPRIGLKMATGSGKTVVMAMLIAWQVANKAFSPRDARFTNRFLVVTPGITIRDRLRVLLPADQQNYYDLRGLVPPDLRTTIDTASIDITNYHSFLPRTAKEVQGVSTARVPPSVSGFPPDGRRRHGGSSELPRPELRVDHLEHEPNDLRSGTAGLPAGAGSTRRPRRDRSGAKAHLAPRSLRRVVAGWWIPDAQRRGGTDSRQRGL
jgi:type III restriction enzyme